MERMRGTLAASLLAVFLVGCERNLPSCSEPNLCRRFVDMGECRDVHGDVATLICEPPFPFFFDAAVDASQADATARDSGTDAAIGDGSLDGE